MKTKLFTSLTLAFLSILSVQLTTLHGQGTAFTYQGRLSINGTNATGTYDLRFILYTSDIGGSQTGPILTNTATTVSGGLFTVALNFGGVFNGTPYWLEIGVRTNGSGSFSPLNPRQPLTPTPYAVFAEAVGNGGLPGVYSNAITLNNPANSFTGNGGGLTNVNAATVGGVSAANLWKTGGNAGTTAGINFVGTTDNQPLELKAFGQRIARFEPIPAITNSITGAPGYFFLYSNAPNVIAGSPLNVVDNGASGVFIGGGAASYQIGSPTGSIFFATLTNHVSAPLATIGGGGQNTIQSDAYFGTIGGGNNNTLHTGSSYSAIGGGSGNVIQDQAGSSTIAGGGGNTIDTNSSYSAIGGGSRNTITNVSQYATIGGGSGNSIEVDGSYSSVGGGIGDVIRSRLASVGGGYRNTIEAGSDLSAIGGGDFNVVGPNADHATVPGGYLNHAGASYSFAAGSRAQANHAGTFVWSDSTADPFVSSGANQFLIRATGGVGIGTRSPHHQLRVSGGPQWTANGWGGAMELDNGGAIAWNANAAGNRFGLGQSSGGFYVFATASDPGNTANPANYLMTFSDSGKVGIGTITPAYLLHVNGSAGKPGGGSWTDSSDARIKKNIQPLRGALDKLTQLRGVSFEWINPADHANQTGRVGGFVAQEVDRIFPHWIQEIPGAEHDTSLTPNGRVKSLSLPFEFNALTVEALRELRAEKDAAVQQLNQRFTEELKRRDAENAELKQRLDRLEQHAHSF